MYAKNLVATSALVAAVAAVPMAKRDIVWETETHVNIVTVPATTTVWVNAAGEPVAAPTTRAHFGHGHHDHGSSAEATTTSAAPVETSSSSYEEPSSYEAPSTSTSVYVAPTTSSTSEYVAPTTSSTSEYVAPTTSSTSEYVAPTTSSTSVYVAPTTSSTSEYVAPTTTSVAPVPSAYEPSSTSAAPASTADSAPGSTYTGDITHYSPGLGSCGWTSSSSDNIVAIAHGIMDNGANPNNNPLCGQTITISYQGSTHQAKVVDTCPGCEDAAIDLSPSLFEAVAPNGDGRVHGVEWWFNSS
ncbi:hypothetical protein KC363_g6811 [Hortaea werneckii]|uniref:RlpA-like protein double-psi beta-barrel domain-containing protein n=1 Tax=Hortaea werneckii TaxID=91943 RepID=A0A3M7F283_HORWE|nr:hypothetical protein KC361_g8687 [Hortaea werneckii]KAI6889133.1 hypothetical protein KC325_g801 [Hortaea werneckii]KAI7088203.1 hypothetical protein KC356_g3550 [Hortaea werneckii]KAI7150281.1 hypothetical protein KC344_g335 [Hortaea werneckii]KAI7176963.1 hypothetical protein KC360_g2674 [Hortaea werneckii]